MAGVLHVRGGTAAYGGVGEARLLCDVMGPEVSLLGGGGERGRPTLGGMVLVGWDGLETTRAWGWDAE